MILIISYQNSANQTFLESFKNYRLGNVDKMLKPKTKKRFEKLIEYQLIEFDTIFKSYKIRKGFDFDHADTLFIIYYASLMSPYTYDITIWSGRDTISYKQGLQMTDSIEPYKYKRIITYNQSNPTFYKPEGFTVFTERDSLIKLVSKRDFITINHLGDNQNINDGGYYMIYIAYKSTGEYKFETCFPNQFYILDIYRKE